MKLDALPSLCCPCDSPVAARGQRSRNADVRDEHVAELARSCSLRSVDLTFCGATFRSVIELREAVPTLRVVRRMPEWMCGRVECPWGETHTYWPDGGFVFTRSTQSRGVVTSLARSAASPFCADRLLYLNPGGSSAPTEVSGVLIRRVRDDEAGKEEAEGEPSEVRNGEEGADVDVEVVHRIGGAAGTNAPVGPRPADPGAAAPGVGRFWSCSTSTTPSLAPTTLRRSACPPSRRACPHLGGQWLVSRMRVEPLRTTRGGCPRRSSPSFAPASARGGAPEEHRDGRGATEHARNEMLQAPRCARATVSRSTRASSGAPTSPRGSPRPRTSEDSARPSRVSCVRVGRPGRRPGAGLRREGRGRRGGCGRIHAEAPH